MRAIQTRGTKRGNEERLISSALEAALEVTALASSLEAALEVNALEAALVTALGTYLATAAGEGMLVGVLL